MPLGSGYDESLNKSYDRVEDKKWVKMFPTCVADKDKSSNFMTRSIFVVFSMIMSRRNLLPSDHFSSNHITEKIKVKTLNFNHPEALKIAQLLRAVGDAVKLGFLDELALVVSNNEGDEQAIEVFSFKMHYFDDGGVAVNFTVTEGEEEPTPFEKLAKVNYDGTQSVRDRLILLARSVVLICGKILQPLPAEFSANFRISYTSQAPEGFRVQGFSDSASFYTLHPDIQTATLGHLRPGHHGALASCSSVFMADEFEAEKVLKRMADKLAENMGFATSNGHDTLYASFACEQSNGSFQNVQNVTSTDTTGVVPMSSPNADESLAKELEECSVANDSQPKTRSRRQAASKRSSPYDKKSRK